MNRNPQLLGHLLHDTSGADLIEYGLIAVALLLTTAAASSVTARMVTEINILDVLAATCSVNALVGFVLPLTAAIEGH
ncbi:MAG: hypothetical protein WBW84_14430 [Acidobacteriaceae bacterium]